MLLNLERFFNEGSISSIFEYLLKLVLVIPVVDQNVVRIAASENNQSLLCFLARWNFLLWPRIYLLGPTYRSALLEGGIRHFVSYESEWTNTVNTVHFLVVVDEQPLLCDDAVVSRCGEDARLDCKCHDCGVLPLALLSIQLHYKLQPARMRL